MFTSAVVSLALAASTLARPYITAPVTSTTWSGGQQATVTYIESGEGPTLKDFGPTTFGIFVGNADTQTLLQVIADSVDVSTTPSFTFTVDATIGPNSNEYFIRAASLGLADPAAPQYPAEVFSSKFSMTGMSGSFNSSVQAEINGQSTAPIGPTTTSGSTTATSSATSNATSTSTSMTTTSTSTTMSMSGTSMPMPSSTVVSITTTAAGSQPTSGASKPVLATGFVALVAALVGAALL